MAHIIGVVQVKGGAGRSTIATNIAAALSHKSNTVLIDCDIPQATSISWAAQRKSRGRLDNLRVARASDHMELIHLIQKLQPECEYLVLDGPPRIAELTRAIMFASNLCLIPLAPSLAEIWALDDLLTTLNEVREHRPDVDARIVWNRCRENTRVARELHAAVEAEILVEQLQTRLAYRVAYNEALAKGLSVLEWRDAIAREEFGHFLREIWQIIVTKKKVGHQHE